MSTDRSRKDQKKCQLYYQILYERTRLEIVQIMRMQKLC